MKAHTERICVVGSGTRFLSGISYYTHQLSSSLARSHQVSVILMRQLLPTRLYPGAQRVGAPLTTMEYGPDIPTFDGVDWYWLPSMICALLFLRQRRPDVLLLEWWTGTALHSYLLLALAARWLGSRVVIEFHEVLDVGELRMPLARAYVHLLAPMLFRLAHGSVVHSAFDEAALTATYHLDRYGPVAVIPHGPYTHHVAREESDSARASVSRYPDSPCRLLYFGVIREYKGVEDLIAAFGMIPESEAAHYRLTIVGETWEGWTRPAELIAASPYRDRIRFVNRYVTDEEVAAFYADSEVVVLPYHRSSASGPLHIAMSHGLPVVVTRVGGLIEAVRDYAGAVLVEPHNPEDLWAGVIQAAHMRGRRFVDPHAWETNVRKLDALLDGLAPVSRQRTEDTEVAPALCAHERTEVVARESVRVH